MSNEFARPHEPDQLAEPDEPAGPNEPAGPDELAGPDEPDEPDERRVEQRSHLTPEETAAGSDDARRQAEIILEDSDERTEEPEATKRASSQTPD